MKTFQVLTLSVCLAGVLSAVSSTAFAQELTVSVEGTSGFPISKGAPPAAGSRAGTAPALAISSLTIGYDVAGYPCYPCVAPSSIAESFPLVVLSPGAQYTVVVQLDDYTYTGSPSVNYSLLQNGKVLHHGSVVIPAFSGNQVNYAAFTGTLPSTTGAITISAEVLQGSTVYGKRSLNAFVE